MDMEQLTGRARAQQFEFVRNIWPGISEEEFRQEDYDRLFKFIDRETSITSEYPGRYSKHGVEEIAECIRFLRENSKHSKSRAISENQTSPKSDDEVISRTLDLAATVWTTSRVGSELNTGSVTWNIGWSLQESIRSHFFSRPIVDDTKRDIIPRSLTVAYLCKEYGFRVLWTDDLCRHLSVDWENHRIMVYEHLIYLWNSLNYPTSTPIPKEILEEAVDTINLLFPSDQKRTKRFLRDEHRTFNRLGYCGRERRMRLSNYRHWRARISVLKDALDDPPKGYRQLLLDKEHRNFLTWATFWIAVAVVALTIVSIVTGIVGIVYSVLSYRVAVGSLDVGIKHLELATAMVCADTEMAVRLPHYCSGDSE